MWILSVAFLAVILIAALILGLARRRHKWIPALILFGATLLSVVISALVSRAFVNACGGLLRRLLTPLLSDEVQGWLDHLPTGTAGIGASLGLLAAPLLFVLLFLIINLILRIIAGIVTGVCFKKKESFGAPGFLIGIGNGIVVGLVLLLPLTCLLTSVGGIAGTFFDTGADRSTVMRNALDETTAVRVRNAVDEVNDNFMLKTVNTLAGKPVMALIGSPKIEVSGEGGTRSIAFSLNDLLEGFARSAGYALLTVDDVNTFLDTKEMTDGVKSSIDRTFDSVLTSDWLTQTCAEAISAVSGSWLDGKAFYSLGIPELPEFLQPTFRTLLGVLSTETGDRLKADLTTVKEIFYLLCDNRLVMGDFTMNEVMNKLFGDGLLDSVMDLISKNEHLSPMSGEYKELGFRVLSYVLEKDALEGGTYNEALDTIVPVLNDVLDKTPEERETIVRDAVRTAFEDYGIEVPEELAVSVAEEVIASAGADGEITRDELLDFLVSHYDVAAEVAEELVPGLE